MKNKILIFIIFSLFYGYTNGFEINLKTSDTLNYIPGEVIVKYKDSNPIKSSKNNLSLFSSELESNNLEIKENLGDITVLEIKDEKSVEETIELLNKNPNIEYVEPNYIRYLFTNYNSSVNTNDPQKSQQWALEYINRPEAYNIYSGALTKTSVPVAVIDNGVNYNHPDLSGSMWSSNTCKVDGKNIPCKHGYDFYHNENTPLSNGGPNRGHGTHIAGIIGANINNGIGIIGVNPHSKIVSLKIGRSDLLSISDEVRALQFAIDNDIKIVNASYGATGTDSDIEKDAIRNFGDNGGLFIAAAGNDHMDLDSVDYIYPCSYDLENIICVASVDEEGNLSTFSNYGNISVDIAAPGTDIYSTYIEEGPDYTVENYREFSECLYNSVPGRNYGNCSTGWEEYGNGYSYSFTGYIQSPTINIDNTKNNYIYFLIACTDANLKISYSNDGGNSFDIHKNVHFGYIGDEYMYPIPHEYSDNFVFKLELEDNNSCLIDDIAIIIDPYISGNDDTYLKESGTSMATPFVAGLVSLVWAINPDLSNIQVKNLILENGSTKNNLMESLFTGKVINVKETLKIAAYRDIPPITGLQSSWTGNIKWNEVNGISKYYFEIFSGNNIIKTGFVENDTSTGLNITGNYTRTIQGLDNLGNKSDLSTGYICAQPILTEENLIGTFSGYECSILNGSLNYNDNCSDFYEIIRNDGTGTSTLTGLGTVTKNIYIKNQFGEESNHLDVDYNWYDSGIIISKNPYTYTSTIVSISKYNIGNIISLLGVMDGNCGNNSISLNSISCSEGEGMLSGNDLTISVPSNKEGTGYCNIILNDDEGNQATGIFNYSFNTIQAQTQTNNGGGGGGGGSGGGGGGGGGGSTNTSKTNNNTKNIEENSTGNNNLLNTGETKNSINTGEIEKLVLAPQNVLKLFDENNNNNKNNNFDFSRYNNENPSNISSNGYTVEFNNAYEFAHRAGVTTTDSIEKANMNGDLTRIAMAKMLSNYAINILGKIPTNSTVPNFPDVSQELNNSYEGAVTLAYQLGIMGKGISKFRPKDTVNRAEFGTALSRMLYGTKDGDGNYYSTHLDKLYKEGVINNINPNLKELRGYVMIMLMRSAKDN